MVDISGPLLLNLLCMLSTSIRLDTVELGSVLVLVAILLDSYLGGDIVTLSSPLLSLN